MSKLLGAVISLGSDLDLASVLQHVVEAGVDLTSARYGALGVLDQSGTGLAEFITVGVDAETKRRIGAPPKGLGLLGALITDARPLRVADVREYAGRSGFPEGHPPMTSFLGVPIRVRGEVFGNLYLTDKQDGEVFTDVDEELVLGLASAAGVAIESARLVEQLRRREAALSALQEVATSVLRSSDATESLGFVTERARVLARADVATLALPAPDSESFVMDVVDGEFGVDLVGAQFPRSGSISGEVLSTGETEVFTDLSRDVRRSQPQVMSGKVGPAIFVPLIAGERFIGTLAVCRALGSRPFSPSDVDMVRSFAAQAGVVLDTEANRQRLTRLSLLEEQERIGRDLHDTVVQQVFAVGLSLQGTIGMARDPEVASRISGAVDALDAVIRQIRTVIFDVSPSPALTATGLRGEMEAVLREVSRGLGFEPDVHFDESVDTIRDRGVRQAAVATLREALSNVARHARATAVQVEVVAAEGCLILRVGDDGVGLTSDAAPGAGKGLRNMRARAEHLGGRFRIQPGPGGAGTLIEWMVPLS